MKIKSILLLTLFLLLSGGAYAQKDISVGQITVTNLGDGRLLHRSAEKEKPLQGEQRIIDGYNAAYIEAKFKDGLYDGAYKRVRHNQLAERGTYKAGRREGIFTEYFSDGATVKEEKSFREGKLDGMLKKFYTDGSLEMEKGYKNGLEDGIERKYEFRTGKMTVDANYVANKPEGKQMRSITSNIGDWVEISNYQNGVLVGEFSQTWTNGKIRTQGTYVNGKREGNWIEYGKNGRKQNEINYVAGERSGELKTFYSDGSIEKIDLYVDGERNGLSREFYPETGKLKSEFNYVDNVKEGKYKCCYDDGSLREEGRMEMGEEISRKEYYRNGQLRQVSELNCGRLEVIEKYDSDGKQM